MNKAAQASNSSRLSKLAITLACLLIVGAVLWQLLPKASFSSDLSQVGQGRPALVMLREIHVMGGERVMDDMLSIYPDYEQDMVFLVVHTGHPDGQAFSREHNVRDGELVLFDAAGTALQRSERPVDAEALRRFIDQHLI